MKKRVLLLLAKVSSSFDDIITTFLFGKETLKFDEVVATLLMNETQWANNEFSNDGLVAIVTKES